MNNIDVFLNQYRVSIEKMAVKQGPNIDKVYEELCNYNSEQDNLSEQVFKVVSYVDKRVKEYVSEYLVKGKPIDITYINENKGQMIKYLNVYFNKCLPSVSETIQIYLCIDYSYYSHTIISIYEYLLDHKISFVSRIVKVNRNDNFIIALYSKQDVCDLLRYINANFSNNLKSLNPFIYQVNNVGIVKDISENPYNYYIAGIIQDYIEECIVNQRSNPYTSNDFYDYIKIRYEDASNYQDKQMGYNLIQCIYSIIYHKNILEQLNDKYIVEYSHSVLNKYKLRLIDNQTHYYLDNNEVDYKTMVYIKALECLKHLYYCRYGEEVGSSYRLNHRVVNSILMDLEMMLVDKKYNNIINYISKTVHSLIPYLYGYIALKYKGISEDECKELIENINNKLTVLQSHSDKYYYLIDNQVVMSSIPIIKNHNGLVAIDYIDENNNLANITLIENGQIQSYLNVYVDIDRIMLKNDHNYYGRLYRNVIGEVLLNKVRNEKALKMRQTDFQTCFISDSCEEANKWVKIKLIKQIFKKNCR